MQSAPFVFCLKKLGWCRHLAMGYWRGIWNGSTSCSDLVWIAERTKLGFNFSQGLLQIDQTTNIYGKNTRLWIPSFIMDMIYDIYIYIYIYIYLYYIIYIYICYIKMYILQNTFCCTYIFDETYVQISGGRATGKIWEMRSLQRWNGTSISTRFN